VTNVINRELKLEDACVIEEDHCDVIRNWWGCYFQWAERSLLLTISRWHRELCRFSSDQTSHLCSLWNLFWNWSSQSTW